MRETEKDFNAMLRDSKDMPKFQTITDAATIKSTADHGCTLLRPWPMMRL